VTEETLAQTGSPSVGPSHTDRILDSHLHCISCQYDLHSLSASGVCPECACEISATIDAITLDDTWLRTIRTGVRWMVASLYVAVLLGAFRSFGPIELVVVSLMHFGGALCLITPNPKLPRRHSNTPGPLLFLGIALGGYFLASISPISSSSLKWVLLPIATLAHLGGLALLWRRIETLMDLGISPNSAVIARNLYWLTISIAVFSVLTAASRQLTLVWSPVRYAALASAGLLMVGLLVWYFASLITLHLMSISIRRLIGDAPATAASP